MSVKNILNNELDPSDTAAIVIEVELGEGGIFQPQVIFYHNLEIFVINIISY